MKFELNVTKEHLITWLEAAKRAAASSASRSTLPTMEELWTKEVTDISVAIQELKTGQLDLAKK